MSILIHLWVTKVVSGRQHKAISCLTFTQPRGKNTERAPGGTGADGTAGCVSISLSSRQRDRGPYSEQMGTKEVAVCWNYRGALIDNLPGWRSWRQGWRKEGCFNNLWKQHQTGTEVNSSFGSSPSVRLRHQISNRHQNSTFNQSKDIF